MAVAVGFEFKVWVHFYLIAVINYLKTSTNKTKFPYKTLPRQNQVYNNIIYFFPNEKKLFLPENFSIFMNLC